MCWLCCHALANGWLCHPACTLGAVMHDVAAAAVANVTTAGGPTCSYGRKLGASSYSCSWLLLFEDKRLAPILSL
jgi:hypothetical protein